MALFSNWGGLCTRGRRCSVEARDPEGRTIRVRRAQGTHTQQCGGCESGVKQTCRRKKGVSEIARTVYGLGQTATVAGDLGFGGVRKIGDYLGSSVFRHRAVGP